MNTKTKRKVGSIVYNVIVCFFGLIMLYPLVWMVMSSFKETSTIFTTAGSLIPEKATLENYVNGWKGFGKVSFGTFFSNSMFISVIATVGTVISSSLVAYGFSRCKFKGRGLLFAAMLVSMMLPAQVLMIPQYLWYQKLGWVGTYLPLIVPYFFAIQGFFVYLILNFIDGIPKDLDEAARIDGANPVQMFFRIKLPYLLSVQGPSLVTDFVKNVNNFNVIYLLTQGVFVTQNQALAQSNAKEIDLLVTWLFRLTQDYYNYKMAAVLGIMVFIVCAVFTVVCFHFINKKEATFS